MNDVTVTDAITSVVVETGNVVEISETNNQVTIADKTNLTVTQTTNSVSIENVENKVEVLSTAITLSPALSVKIISVISPPAEIMR